MWLPKTPKPLRGGLTSDGNTLCKLLTATFFSRLDVNWELKQSCPRPPHAGMLCYVDGSKHRLNSYAVLNQSQRLRAASEGSPSDGSEGSEDRIMPQSHPLLPSGQG